jgi:class 3 adenylate cyclase/DNA-binding NarL/FixJ family response regulator
MTIRVVLGDDNVLVREGVRALLGATDGIDVVGVAEDAPTLLAAVDEFRPDVVVTDIKMPPNFQLEGIECAHEIRQKLPGTGVVVLSAHDDEAYALALLGGGDHGLAYLLKDRLGQGDELARAIKEVASGGSVIDPTIASRLSGSQERSDVDRTILDLMAKGFGYAELAQELRTSQEAIDRMVTGLFQRLAAEGNVDVFKRLHSAVVDVEASARTLRSFVPAQLAAKLASGGEVNAQEEVEVTVLFSDIRGFSTLAEQLSAREVAGILARHLSAMAGVVLEYGGTIDKFAGDGVMAIFGAPDPVPDHAALALRCALAMQTKQRQLNWETWTEGLPQLGIGIGVNTGTVIAGTVGGAGRLEYTVLGDAVNLAQRLQAEAGANEILATAATVQAAAGIPAESIGSRQVKGRMEPVETFRITISEEAGEPPPPR